MQVSNSIRVGTRKSFLPYLIANFVLAKMVQVAVSGNKLPSKPNSVCVCFFVPFVTGNQQNKDLFKNCLIWSRDVFDLSFEDLFKMDFELFQANEVLCKKRKSNEPVPRRKCIKRYTLSIFLERAKAIHGEKYNYSHVKEEHIQGKDSKVFVICKVCDYKWTVSIHGHINRKHGCSNCYGNVPWTLEKFIKKATEIHKDKYDYSHIEREHIRGKRSKVPIVCLKCNHFWHAILDNHINGKRGCPQCAILEFTMGTSKTEQLIVAAISEVFELDKNTLQPPYNVSPDFKSKYNQHFGTGFTSIRPDITLKLQNNTVFIEYDGFPDHNSEHGIKKDCAKTWILLSNDETNIVIRIRPKKYESLIGKINHERYFEFQSDCATANQILEVVYKIYNLVEENGWN
jgi:formylmethanofuran dehydrogenase subunit E